MSSWNPPPGNRKMHGDLMYLNVLTIEDKELNITSSTRGFYLNQYVSIPAESLALLEAVISQSVTFCAGCCINNSSVCSTSFPCYN